MQNSPKEQESLIGQFISDLKKNNLVQTDLFKMLHESKLERF